MGWEKDKSNILLDMGVDYLWERQVLAIGVMISVG